jgi:hypothetical protein
MAWIYYIAGGLALYYIYAMRQKEVNSILNPQQNELQRKVPSGYTFGAQHTPLVLADIRFMAGKKSAEYDKKRFIKERSYVVGLESVKYI